LSLHLTQGLCTNSPNGLEMLDIVYGISSHALIVMQSSKETNS
jgi:hypothetical protein